MARVTRPLFERFPNLRAAAPIVEIGEFPTPVAPLKALAAAWGVDLWVKRDDVTGTEFGGNKVRKLEFLLADAKARAERIWAYAVTGSNWAVAVAHYGKRLGIPVDLLLFKRPINPYLQKNLDLARGLARSSKVTRSVATIPFHGLVQLMSKGRTYLMPPGGSSALSTLGYINAGLELGAQVQAGAMPAPDVVVVALGTGGTLAGVHAGLRLAGLKAELVGVRVADRIISNATYTARIARRATALLARRAGDASAALSIRARDFRVVHDFIGKGYGIPTTAGDEAAHELAEREGLRAESTYTAKALAAVKSMAPALRGKRVLFWLTCNSRPVEGLGGPA
jgi:1-aminocyclopropane-1-carboxylate deaminase/D-cysteine desulfhydrase-like pyridoxal-dependent ACC family enzyme